MADRECRRCPDNVVRCFHLGKRVVLLGSQAFQKHAPSCAVRQVQEAAAEAGYKYNVLHLRYGGKGPCSGCARVEVYKRVKDGDVYFVEAYFTFATAQEGFEAEVAKLKAQMARPS